jgi:hypothetical protein
MNMTEKDREERKVREIKEREERKVSDINEKEREEGKCVI